MKKEIEIINRKIQNLKELEKGVKDENIKYAIRYAIKSIESIKEQITFECELEEFGKSVKGK
jgi:hypothetical protein